MCIYDGPELLTVRAPPDGLAVHLGPFTLRSTVRAACRAAVPVRGSWIHPLVPPLVACAEAYQLVLSTLGRVRQADRMPTSAGVEGHDLLLVDGQVDVLASGQTEHLAGRILARKPGGHRPPGALLLDDRRHLRRGLC